MKRLRDLAKKLKGFGDAMPNAVQRAADKVVKDLQEEGPYYTGNFHDSWEIQLNREGASARSTTAYITNTASYAYIAMDLVPGRWKGGMPPNTAPQDWYITYVAGGQMDKSVQVTADDFLLQTWRRGL